MREIELAFERTSNFDQKRPSRFAFDKAATAIIAHSGGGGRLRMTPSPHEITWWLLPCLPSILISMFL